ncbi:hypothetical protein LOZ58_004789 [Ophidiomyces ophidiicola]|nr:hypothetical protein LOZ58_004789 [Ophidiomyces ophidiicola]
MAGPAVLRKDQLETSLYNERELIRAGKLKEDNPLDLSDDFKELCEACRRGDLKVCHEKIALGVNINGRDLFDCTPLILASLCGHYDVVRLLLESGALCERDTFQGERCLYNALNENIRNLLLKYDYSKATDPLQPYAAHITSLLTREHPRTSDIVVTSADESFHLHKFILSARSPYFRKKLLNFPNVSTSQLPITLPPQAFSAGIRYLYFGDTPRELRSGPGTGFSESEVLAGIDKIATQLGLHTLMDTITDSGDRRLARQRRVDESAKGRDDMEIWFQENVLKHKIVTDTDSIDRVKWSRDNMVFADVLLQADEDATDAVEQTEISHDGSTLGRIPIGPKLQARKSVLYPVHRAMLLRSEFFLAMFSSGFREAQMSEHLQVISVDCAPDVLEIVLTFLYTEKANFPLNVAIDVLYAADLLMIERLKNKAALIISSLGSGNTKSQESNLLNGAPAADQLSADMVYGLALSEAEEDEEPVDIYEIMRAGWFTRVQRLEEFAARYLANRLEKHIDRPEFEQLVLESAARIEKRHKTDTIELIDDIRYYLDDRFRMRFEEDCSFDEMEENSEKVVAELREAITEPTSSSNSSNTDTPSSSSSDSRAAGTLNPENICDFKVELSGHAPKESLFSPQTRSLSKQPPVSSSTFSRDAANYQLLQRKLDILLEKLNLDA